VAEDLFCRFIVTTSRRPLYICGDSG
jgi:hypothetical protein